MKILVLILLVLVGCASGTPAPTAPSPLDLAVAKRGIERHLEQQGYTFAAAMGDWMNGGDMLKAAQKVMLSCKNRVQSEVRYTWHLAITDRQASIIFCRPFLIAGVETWLKEQEVIMGSVTKDPDRLPPGVRKPAPFYREPKRYENVKADVDKMLAALKEGLTP